MKLQWQRSVGQKCLLPLKKFHFLGISAHLAEPYLVKESKSYEINEYIVNITVLYTEVKLFIARWRLFSSNMFFKAHSHQSRWKTTIFESVDVCAMVGFSMRWMYLRELMFRLFYKYYMIRYYMQSINWNIISADWWIIKWIHWQGFSYSFCILSTCILNRYVKKKKI